MDHEPHTVRGRVSSGGSRTPSIVVAAIAAFLIVAAVKPWSFGGTDRARPTAPATPPAGSGPILHDEPSPTATAGIPDPDAMACLSSETDQLVAIERWSGHEIRSWVATPDTIGSGPLDTHIVPIAIYSSHVVALGMCAKRPSASGSPDGVAGAQAPAPGGDVPAAARLIDVRSIVETVTGPVVVDLGIPDPISAHSGGTDAARLYGPPNATPGRSPGPSGPDPSSAATARPRDPPPTDQPSWPLGAYAIAFRFDLDPPDLVRWLRLDINMGAGQ
jgi:hypothetical protein